MFFNNQMKTSPPLPMVRVALLFLLAVCLPGIARADWPLGPIGGTYNVIANSSAATVTSLTAGAPGAAAGLQVGDYIYGAFGQTFTPTGSYHYGVSQELGFAVDRAEGGDGILPLLVLRPGTGGFTANVVLSPVGALGVAYPRNSPKFAAMYETAVADLHTRAMNSNGSMGYFTGWTGLALLGHPDWNTSTGAKPYRLSVNKVKDFVIGQINSANYTPTEDLLLTSNTALANGGSNPNSAGGVSNWEHGQKMMFLAEYYTKTKDFNEADKATVAATLQRGAEMCANTVQWWKQPSQTGVGGFSPEYDRVAGMCSHGGVTGDYMHQGWYCGINITGVYNFNGMGFARRAGMDMTVRPRDGHYFGYNVQPGDAIPDGAYNALPASITLPQYGADPVRGASIANSSSPVDRSHASDPFWYNPSVHQKFAMQLNFLARRSTWYDTTNPLTGDDGMVGYAPEAISAYDAGGRTPGTLLGMAMYQQDVGGLDAADLTRMESLKGYITRNYMRHQEAHAYCVGAQVYQAMCTPYLSDRQQRFFMDNWRFFFALSRTPTNGLQYFPSRSVADNYLDTNHCASINIALPYAIANGNYSLIPAYNTNRIIANFKSPLLTWPSQAARYGKVYSSAQPFVVDICDGNGNVLTPANYTATWTHVSGPATATFTNPSGANITVNFPKPGRYRIQLAATSGSLSITEPIDLDVYSVTPPVGYTIGMAGYNVYTGISGSTVADLTSAAKYPASPDATGTISSLEGTYSGDNYGQRLRGYIVPPVTGTYRFYISSDDASRLIFNSAGPAETTTVIVSQTGWNSKYSWTNQSTTFNLTAGQPYYFEVLHKEGTGGDHVAVAWTNDQGISSPTIIGGESLAIAAGNAIVYQPVNQVSTPGGSANFSVTVSGAGPVFYQWRRNGVALWGSSTSPVLALTNLPVGAAGSYDCVITTPTGVLISNAAQLSISSIGVRTAGGLKRETWSSLSGSAVANLTGYARYPMFPDATAVATTAETAENTADNYGEKLSGWIIPPTTGNYRFFLSSDDASELWLSTNDSSANATKRAELLSSSGFRTYAAASANIAMVAGQRYYIEILHKESSGGDHLSLAWQTPGGTQPTTGTLPIDGAFLEYENFVPLTDHWKLDETTGTTAVNSIRTANNGTHVNGTAVNQAGASPGTGYSAYYDGLSGSTTGDSTSIPAPNYNTNNLTMMAWVKRNGNVPSWGPILFSRAGNTIAGFGCGTANDLRYHWNGAQSDWDSGLILPDAQWVLAALVVTPTGATIHMRTTSGLQSATQTVALTAEEFNGLMYIGADTTDSARRFKGNIDDVRVYKGALTATEIEALYQAGVSPAPVMSSLAMNVAENSAIGTAVGTVTATDPNPGQTITYAIVSGNAAGCFALNPTTGAVTVASPPDFESTPVHTLIVGATDNGSPAQTTTATVTIAITNVNESPYFASDPVVGAPVYKDNAYAGTLTASDPDIGATVTYAKLTGPAWLSISTGGAMTGTPSAANAGVNVFTVRATDNTGLSTDATLNISVINPSDAPIWTNPAGGSWLVAANWFGNAVADGAGITVDFSTLNLTADTAVTLDGARTIGGLKFGDTMPNYNWTLSTGTGGPLTLQPGSGSPIINVVNQTATVGTALAGTMGLTKSGTGMLVLSGANTYTGNTFLSAGTLRVGAGGATGNLGGTVVTNNGLLEFYRTGSLSVPQSISGTGNIYVKPGGTFDFSGPISTNIFRIQDGGSRTITFSGSAANTINVIEDSQDGHCNLYFSKSAGVTAFSGPVLHVGSGYASQFLVRLLNSNQIADTTTVTMYGWDGGYGGRSWFQLNGFNETIAGLSGGSGTSYVQNAAATPSVLTLSGTGNYSVGGYVSNGSTGTLSLVMNGTGFQTLSGGGINYTGTTSISNGTLRLSQATGYASSTTTVNASGVLELIGTNTAVDTWRLNTVLAGAGVINKTGVGWIQTNTNAHTFSGTVNIYAGAFGTSNLNSNWAGVTADFNVSDGALLDARGQAITLGGLNGAGKVGNTWTNAASVTVGAGNKSGVFTGVISGNASSATNLIDNPNAGVLNLIKTGTGSQTLSGINTYTGTTTVGNGTLLVNGSLASAATTVAAPATLGGSGTLAGTVVCNGLLVPGGTGIGNLTIGGALTMAPDSSVTWQISDWTGGAGTGHDALTVASLDITATAADPVVIRINELNLVNFTPPATSFILVQSAGAITGFDPAKFVIDRTGFTSGDGSWSIQQSGNNLMLVCATNNSPPVMSGTPLAMNATVNVALTGQLAATDVDGDTRTFDKLSGPAWLTVSSTGALSGTPLAGNSGSNVFVVRVSDGRGGSDIELMTVLVYPPDGYGTLTGTSAAEWINRVQFGGIDNISGNNNGYGNFRNLVAQVTPGQSVSYTLTPAWASTLRSETWSIWIDLNRDGDFADTGENVLSLTTANQSVRTGNITIPANASAGPSRMRIAMKRTTVPTGPAIGAMGNGEVEDYSVQIGTNPSANIAPYFLADPIAKPDVAQGSAITGSLAANAADWDNNTPLSFTKTSGPAWLQVATDGTLSGTPGNSDVGAGAYVVRVTDSLGASDTAALNITVTNVNDAPVFTNPIITGAGGTQDSTYTGTLAGTATDVDPGDTITYSKVSGPAWLTVAADGALAGTPLNANAGSNSFTVRATDPGGLTGDATLNIAIANVNDAPVFTVDPITGTNATEGLAYTGTLAGGVTDPDAGDILTFSKVSGPDWLFVAADGALSGAPGAGDVGPNAFVVRVSDAAGLQDDAALNFTVHPATGSSIWINPSGGAWPAAGNWLDGRIANGSGFTADFSTLNLTTSPTVMLDGARPIGTLLFGDTTPSHNWTVGAGSAGPLTLGVTSGTPVITVNNQTTTLNVPLAGTQGFQKTGGGTLVLGGADSNVYTGDTTLASNSQLILSKTAGAIAVPGDLRMAAPGSRGIVSTTMDNQFGTGSVLRFTSTGDTRLEIKGTTQTFAGIDNTGVTGTYHCVQHSEFGTPAAVDGTSQVVLNVTGANSYTFNTASGALRDYNGGVLGLVKNGTGTQILNGVNVTYTGGTTINGGVLELGGGANVGRGSVTINDGGTLRLSYQDASDSLGAITINAGGRMTASANWQWLNGNITLNGGEIAATVAGHANYGNFLKNTGTLTVTGSQKSIISADFRIYNATQTFNVGVTGDPSGTDLLISGPLKHIESLYWGYVVKTGLGTMEVTNPNNSIGSITVSAGKVLFRDHMSGMANGGLINNSLVDANMAAGINASFGYAISGTGTFTKLGDGSLALSGANTYTGATSANRGILLVNGSLANTSTTVGTDGTLGGTGTIAGTVAATGTLAPGNNAIGNLTVNNTLTLAGGSKLAWEIGNWTGTAGTGWDKITAVALNISATSGSPVTIRPTERTLTNFTETNATFTLVQTTTGITGFSADKFLVDTSGLSLPRGSWTVQQSGNNLVLAYARFNTTPAFVSNPMTGTPGTEGLAYTGTITANDPDPGEVLTYAKLSGPAWLAINSTGTLTGTPLSANIGVNSFTVRVTDAANASAEATLNITVGNMNDAPVFTADPFTAAATEDSAYTGAITATDIDVGDVLSYSKVAGPAWLTVATNGTLGGTPTNGDVGVNHFVVRVTDAGGLTDDAALTITVANVNDTPAITGGLGPIAAMVGSGVSGQIVANDPDTGDTVTITRVNGPAWLAVATDGTLSGTPAISDQGENVFTVRATDASGLFDEQSLTINVISAPYWTNLSGGSWPVPGNWYVDAVADGSAMIGDFSKLDLTADATVTLDGARTIAGMTFGDTTPGNNWILNTGSAGPLTLSAATGTPVINVINGTTTIGAVLAGTQGVIKTGTGTLMLGTANTLTGGVTVSQGSLRVGGNTVLGSNTVTLGDANSGSAPVSWLFPSTVITSTPIVVSSQGTGAVTIGTYSSGSTTTTASGALTLHRATTLFDATGTVTSFSGKISGNVGTLTLAGKRIYISNDTNDFIGDVVITSGCTLHTLGVSALPSTTNVTLNGATYRLSKIGVHAINGLMGSGTVLNGASGTTTLSVGNNGGSGVYDGVIDTSTYSIALTKTGAGTQTLNGDNKYTGSTAVNGGKLIVNGSLANTITTVAAAGTLGGTGTIGGSTTVNGTLAPGAATGVGTLTINATTTVAPGSAIAWDLADWIGTNDKVVVNALNLTATSASRCTLRLTERSLGNFTESSNSFVVVQTTSGITGFAANKFTIDTTGLTTPKGTWAVQQSGNNLVLVYTRFNTAPTFASNPLGGAPGTEGSAYTGTLAASDPDIGETLVYTKLSGPAWLTIHANGTLTGTPTNANVGLNVFSVRVTDAANATAEATLDITVANVNDAPVFTADPFTAAATEDSAFLGAITATDIDAGDSLSYSKVSGPSWLTVATNGMLSGTPTNSDVGANHFVVRVTDAGGLADEAALTITVANVNDAPVFTADPFTATATEDSAFTGAITATDVDAGDALAYSKVSGPAWLTIAPDGTLGGTPANDEVGANNFVVRVTDATGLADDAALTITVANVNDAPVFTVDPITADAMEDSAFTGTITATDIDAGDALTYSKVSGPAWLSVATDGTLGGTPTNSAVGANNFVVRVTDAGGLTDDAALTISVANVNDAPVFTTNPFTAAATEDSAFTGAITATDMDAGDTLTYSKVSGPAWLSVATDGTLSGTPTNSDVDTNTFAVRVTDAGGLTDDAVLTIPVANVNDAPVFTADPITADAMEDSAFTGALTATDVDAGDALVYGKVSGPAWLSVAADGTLGGTPTNGDVGTNTFVVRVTDGSGLSDEATLTVTVAFVNDAPVFTADPITADATEDIGFTGAITATDVDAGDTITYAKVSGPAWLTIATDGTLGGTPTNSEVGANNFVVRVTDAGGLTDEAAFVITVANANDAPVFTADPVTADAMEDIGFTGVITATDVDAGDSLTYTMVSGPAWLTVAPDGTLGGTPINGDVGVNNFVVRVTDVDGLSDEAALTITVTSADANGNGIIDTWETEHFNNAEDGNNVAGDDADGDGISNLMEYAYNTDPLVANIKPLVHDMATVDGSQYLRLTVPKNPAATNLTYTVETSGDLTPGSWSTTQTVVESESATELRVRDSMPGTPARRFIKLKIHVNP